VTFHPQLNRTFLHISPPWGEGQSGDPTKGPHEKSQERPLPREFRGCPAGGRGQRDRNPREPMGPGKFRPPDAHFGKIRAFTRARARYSFHRYTTPRRNPPRPGLPSIFPTNASGISKSPKFGGSLENHPWGIVLLGRSSNWKNWRKIFQDELRTGVVG